MLKLDGIASFVAIVESGSISEAARRLNLTKSVVSQRLADAPQTRNSVGPGHGLAVRIPHEHAHRRQRCQVQLERGCAFAVQPRQGVRAAVRCIDEEVPWWH